MLHLGIHTYLKTNFFFLCIIELLKYKRYHLYINNYQGISFMTVIHQEELNYSLFVKKNCYHFHVNEQQYISGNDIIRFI